MKSFAPTVMRGSTNEPMHFLSLVYGHTARDDIKYVPGSHPCITYVRDECFTACHDPYVIAPCCWMKVRLR